MAVWWNSRALMFNWEKFYVVFLDDCFILDLAVYVDLSRATRLLYKLAVAQAITAMPFLCTCICIFLRMSVCVCVNALLCMSVFVGVYSCTCLFEIWLMRKIQLWNQARKNTKSRIVMKNCSISVSSEYFTLSRGSHLFLAAIEVGRSHVFLKLICIKLHSKNCCFELEIIFTSLINDLDKYKCNANFSQRFISEENFCGIRMCCIDRSSLQYCALHSCLSDERHRNAE